MSDIKYLSLDSSDSVVTLQPDEMPYPIGGIKAISDKITYPITEKQNGVEGTVYVLAYINYYGEVDKVEILKGVSPGLNKAAMDAIKSTKFIPGRKNGIPVKVQVSIPIRFRL